MFLASSDSKVETTVESFDTSNNGEISADENSVEISVSPVKTMKISPDSWKAFLEYKKYYDYPKYVSNKLLLLFIFFFM